MPDRSPAAALPDPRWEALDTVRAARAALGLRDRSIAVLRGLLSLVPVASWTTSPFVHAANTTLQDRCDGIDERTLRRHLTALIAAGLIRRRQSPNRKRYVVRDDSGRVVLAYGFDLTPLRDAVARLAELAADAQRQSLRLRALRAVLRDHLFHLDQSDPRVAALRPLLRRRVTAAVLEQAIADLAPQGDSAVAPCPTPDSSPVPERDQPQTAILTDSDGQNVRDIQRSIKEPFDSEPAATTGLPPVDTCVALTPTSASFAGKMPETWQELTRLADVLGPGLGLGTEIITEAERQLGRKGRTLAVLGLVEAYPRIRQPGAYLRALVTKARSGALDLCRMFRSLTSAAQNTRFPAGNRV